VNHVDSNLAPPAQAPVDAPLQPEHEITVTEAGSFSTARCGCGWSAPARRSRDKSRRDADKHLAEQSDPAPDA